jgi:lipopolysaccharide transport system permease protein
MEGASDGLPVTIIRPSPGWRLPDPVLLWSHRDLLLLLIRRDFTVRYRQTLLGPAWLLLQPLALTGMFTLVFKGFSLFPTDSRPAVLFYFSGLIGWSYASQLVASTGGTFVSNAALFGKVQFPRLVMPLASACSGLFAVILQLIVLGIMIAATHQPIMPWRWLLLPFIFLAIATLALSLGLWIASSTAKYRDLSIATPFLLQLWLFATPIIYPLSSVPEAWRSILAMINPLAPLIEILRWVLIGSGSVRPLWLFTAVIEIAVLFLIGALFFQRVERTVVDTV